jgi:hypothetical protein
MSDLRCPYCVCDGQFRLMTTAGNGRYHCEVCSHQASSVDRNYRCDCNICVEWLTSSIPVTAKAQQIENQADREHRFVGKERCGDLMQFLKRCMARNTNEATTCYPKWLYEEAQPVIEICRILTPRRTMGASRRLIFLVKHPIPSGLLCGVAVHIFMYYLVLPIPKKLPFHQ